MKKSGLFYMLVICLVSSTCISSCKKDDNNNPVHGKGKISINLGVEIEVNDISKKLKSTSDVDSFKVIIYNSGGEVIVQFENTIDVPDEVELEPGEYYIVAHSDNYMPAAFENPYYFGSSEKFSLENEECKTVNVNCELANCAVSIEYSENIKNDFSDYSTTVIIDGFSLTFTKDETRTGYFDLVPITIEAVLEYTLTDSSTATKILTGIIDNPQAKKHYEVNINASLADGKASIEINLDESTDVEIVEITDDTIVIPGAIGYGDLLITEIMYDPSAIPDTEGEWFEIYNNSLSDIDINQLVIKRASDLHIVNQDIILASGDYFVLARSANATSVPKYVYGSDITLTNSGAELIIANYGTDGTNGSEIARINYGASGFPDPTGASLNLDLSHFDVEQSKSGSSWCESTVVYDTGDFGTPGTDNTECD